MFLKYSYEKNGEGVIQKILNLDNAVYIDVRAYKGSGQMIINQSRTVNIFYYKSLDAASEAYNQIVNAIENHEHIMVLPSDGLIDIKCCINDSNFPH